ncbi:MAG: N-acetylneuraminate synthase [Phycisphaerae bacterium]|nr:MAG: N-acetylneuraminate synthase family protein [Planctomycetia bacterium]RIK67543.1 MAG: N-acetylneuraminate synthase [Planctomycetota bacterium]GJQ24988.1 MAG: N-acetylneuraminate synthase [Phycisphaerae bacterium]
MDAASQPSKRSACLGRPDGVYIIAEAGVNHDGCLEKARALIDAARSAGADAVKFQAFSAARIAAADAPTCAYQATEAGESQARMLARLELSPADFAVLKRYAEQRGIAFLCTPFSIPDLEMLVALGVSALKIASPDIVNVPLLRAAAATGLPLIASTGAATLDEIDAAVALLTVAGARDRLSLLHCVSAYPTRPAEARLGCIRTLADRFGCPVGFSDHTDDAAFAALAVAAGARILEKHLTLDRSANGPDHFFSLEPDAMARYVATARAALTALGDGRVAPSESELEVRRLARGSLVTQRPLRAGEALAAEHLLVQRPAGGIPPDAFDSVIGRVMRVDVPAQTRIEWSMLA